MEESWKPEMRKFLQLVSWIFYILGAFLIIIGISCLPSGGLMFALPYVFILPGLMSVGIGAALSFLGKMLHS